MSTLRRSLAATSGLLVAACLIVGFQNATAQEVAPKAYSEPGINPNKDYINQHPTEYIEPFNGALQQHFVDLFLPGNGGLDLKVIRSYNSSAVDQSAPAMYKSLAGLGWTVHFGRVLKPFNQANPFNPVCTDGSTGDVSYNPALELPDGSRQLLVFPGGTAPLMITAQRWRVDCGPSGVGVTAVSPEGVRYEMAQKVSLPGGAEGWYTTSISDRNGNKISVQYAAADSPEITRVSASDGRVITFTYWDSGLNARRIKTITTNGRVFTYNYAPVTAVLDTYYLKEVVRPDGTKWQYDYEETTRIAGSYLLKKVTYPQGGAINYEFSWVLFDSVANPRINLPAVTKKTTSDGGIWSFGYTPGSLGVYDTTTVTRNPGTASPEVTTYQHYGANYWAPDAGRVWMVGLLRSKRIGSLQTETSDWDRQQISSEMYFRPGDYLSYRRDPATYAPILTQRTILRDGVQYRTTYSSFDSYGNPGVVVEAGPNGGNRTTNLKYYIDRNRWIVKQVDDETTVGVGSVIREWDANGNLQSEARDGVTTSFTRHPTGDVWTMTRPRTLTSTYTNYYRGIPQNEAHPEGVNISRTVSADGNVISETDGELATTTYEYDGLNRLKRITRPVGNPTTITYTATVSTATRGSLVQTTTVDGFGRVNNVTTGGLAVTSRFDPLGRKTFASIVGNATIGHSFQYDMLNRPVQVTHNADGSSRGFTYGASGGVPTLAVRDERNQVATHAFRAYGDPDHTLVMAITAPVASASVSIERNGRGLVTSATQGGLTRSFGYDSRYYMTSTNHPEVGQTLYGRDDAGNMTSKQVGTSGTTVYDYDGRNRLWRVTYPNSSPSQVTNVYWRTDKLRSVTNAVATRTYGYDKNQNLINETLAVDGLSMAATYNYNANDQLASIVYPLFGRTVEFNPDVLGRARSVIASGASMLNATYWPNGQIFDIAYAGGSRATYGQNTREWPTAVTVATSDGVTQLNSTYSYDVAGNVYNIADSVDTSYNRNFSYDGINRLGTINGPWGSGLVQYDGRGNITSYALGADSRTYTYDGQNRLTNVDSSSSGTTRFVYDVYGNASPYYDWFHQYDNAGNLTQGLSSSHTYDGANARVKVVSNGVTTYEFRSAQGLLLAEWRKQSGYYDTLKEHMYLAGRAVAEQQTNFLGSDVRPVSWLFFQPDINGSTLTSTWAGGGLMFKEGYEPYGTQIKGTAAAWTQQAFAGQKQDAPDLVYMGGRFYNPQIGRFWSMDPKEADPSDLHSLNRYAYGNNNPYRYVDPDGRSPLDLAFLAVDVFRLGTALYTGGDVVGAAVDVGFSFAGVFSPVPGTGQVLKSLRVADKVVDGVRAADHAVDVAKATDHVVDAGKAAKVRNGHLAGSKHPETGIPFDKNGFPDFSSVSKAEVKIKQTGTRAGDFKAANEAAGYKKTPEGYTWHHHQDGTTMQLVPRDIHAKTGHTGGFNPGQ